MAKLNKYSSRLTEEQAQVGSKAMLYATGLSEDDMKKPQVGIASTGWDGNPCNMHLNDLAAVIKQSVWEQNLVGFVFHSIGVSDGISMGTQGMKFSLPSRDIIADSIETVMGGQWYDALIALLAEWLGVRRHQIEILAGASGRNKLVRIAGLSRTGLEKLHGSNRSEGLKKLR